MMVEKEDLGLSLSLSFPENRSSMQLNRTTSLASSSSPSAPFNPQKISWLDNFPSLGTFFFLSELGHMPRRCEAVPEGNRREPSGGGRRGRCRSFVAEQHTLSSVSGKRSEREATGDETERASSHGISDEEDADGSRKKLRLSKDQSAILEESFKEHNTLNPKQKLALAKRLGLRPRQVEVWFQNRRARTKLKQTEVDCEFLKRCCENLTEENRRLQKEVQELRALKLSPQFYMQMTPPTTLTMCPSCEHVGVPPSSSSSAPVDHHRPRPHHIHPRPIPIHPWAPTTPVPHRPFNALHPRS
ncbi:homeobox protein 2 [Actinidia rufa]|uniref:Homeobox protein 2 n=1 Tax=Actinidia rufa TaxID=165716 RepID=A0A7J0H1F1_9ERIC|nr:homeobox protein 2 [Actinidia rufa]